MSFSVKPDDLDAFGKLLHRAAEDVEQAREYTKKSCEMFPTDVGPISTVAQLWDGGHKDVLSRVSNSLKRLEKILAASSEEMVKSGAYYESTDREESRKIDNTYPRTKR